MSETLSRILYNTASEAVEAAEDHSYARALSLTQSYLSEHFASTLAETVLQEQAREHVRFLIEQFLTNQKVFVTGMSVQELTTRLYHDMAGYSILEEPLADPEVEEIFVNAYDDIEIVDGDGRGKTSLRFETAEQGQDIARRLVRLAGKTLDSMNPVVEAHLTTGVRITAMLPPIIPAEDGVSIDIRKQRLTNVTRDQLIRWGTASEEVLDFLALCLNHGVSISVAGKTASGKTTLLSYLLNNLDERQRIVTIEETREILIVNPQNEAGQKIKSIQSLCTRPSDDPRLNIDMQYLLRTSLRLSPDVITMAEMRGAEAMGSQEAARTGHTVASTLHANSASQTYARILTMCQMSDTNMLPQLLMSLIVEAFPIAVFCKKVGTRHRCITEIAEAYGVMDGMAKTRLLYQYVQEGDQWRWVRKAPISSRTAEILLSNDADPGLVKHLRTDPDGQKGVKA